MADSMHELSALRERLEEIFGAAAESVWRSMRTGKRQSYWLNPLLERPPEFVPFGIPVPGLDDTYSVPSGERQRVTRHQGADRGWLYPLNPSSLLAVAALDPRPGEEILDLAAAPGGKTVAMAASMGNSGRIAAVEVIRGRFHRLRANLQRCGVTNAHLYRADGRGVGRKVPARFDRVLLDAPCSTEARIRLDDPHTYAHWKPRKIRESGRKQAGLLRSAYLALKPGGVLVYCTCSFAPEENERVVSRLLESTPGAAVEALDFADVPQCAALTAWRGQVWDARVENAVRVLPDEIWDGLFVCRVRKQSEPGRGEGPTSRARPRPPLPSP